MYVEIFQSNDVKDLANEISMVTENIDKDSTGTEKVVDIKYSSAVASDSEHGIFATYSALVIFDTK